LEKLYPSLNFSENKQNNTRACNTAAAAGALIASQSVPKLSNGSFPTLRDNTQIKTKTNHITNQQNFE